MHVARFGVHILHCLAHEIGFHEMVSVSFVQ